MDAQKETKNWLEHLVTIIASILVFFTFAFLVFHLITNKETPADIVVQFEKVIEKSQGFSVQLSVENRGTQTAKDIIIEIIPAEESITEKGQISFQYIPGLSTVEGWVTFSTIPNIHTLTYHVLGYSTP